MPATATAPVKFTESGYSKSTEYGHNRSPSSYLRLDRLWLHSVYTEVEISDRQMLFLGFPLGFLASGIFTGLGPILTELFPSRVRRTGQGFAYKFGRGLGALFPALVGYTNVNTASLY